MGVDLYNLHQIKDNVIIFQSYIDIFELKPAENGGEVFEMDRCQILTAILIFSG